MDSFRIPLPLNLNLIYYEKNHIMFGIDDSINVIFLWKKRRKNNRNY